MKLVQTSILDVVAITPSAFSDDRGWFMESFNESRFHSELRNLNLSVPRRFVQDNHSCSKKGVMRGIHYQLAPYAQGKLVRVTKGSAYDVAVDLRKGSKTYGEWVGVELTESNQKMLWVPEGFGHAFVALEDDTHFLYKTTDYYNKESERSIAWNDESLGIEWQGVNEQLISEKDKIAPKLKDAEVFVEQQSSLIKEVGLRIIGDERGSLIALEEFHNISFDIKRVYYIFNTQQGVSRGFHAHRKLRQLLVCTSGSCRIELDDGIEKKSVCLNSPDHGVLISGLVWREMHDFSEDCVLLVFADEYYQESDYIRDYDDFICEVGHGKS